MKYKSVTVRNTVLLACDTMNFSKNITAKKIINPRSPILDPRSSILIFQETVIGRHFEKVEEKALGTRLTTSVVEGSGRACEVEYRTLGCSTRRYSVSLLSYENLKRYEHVCL